MTVKALTPSQTYIAYKLRKDKFSAKDIAYMFRVSVSTIYKAIKEYKESSKPEVMTESATAVMQLLYEHKVTYEQLKIMLEQTPAGILKHMTQDRATKKSPVEHIGRQRLMFEDIQGH